MLRAGARSEAVEIARASVREAQLQLETERANAAQDQLRLRDVERARAQVAQIENQLGEQSVQLGETRIVAPIGGEIVRKYLEEGELIASATAGFAQGAAIVTIADLGRMQVRVNINEVDVSRVRVGQDVDIRIEGMSGQVFHGRVASIAPASTTALSPQGQNTGESGRSVVRFEVKIAVADRDRRLRPGMTASVEVIQNRKRNVLLLPQEAVRDNAVILVTGTGEKAVKKPRRVQTGLKDIASVEIVSGLKQGDRVEIPRIDAKDRRRIDIGGPD